MARKEIKLMMYPTCGDEWVTTIKLNIKKYDDCTEYENICETISEWIETHKKYELVEFYDILAIDGVETPKQYLYEWNYCGGNGSDFWNEHFNH